MFDRLRLWLAARRTTHQHALEAEVAAMDADEVWMRSIR
jgi:hypothetical protein